MKLNMIKQMERFARSDPSIVSLGQGIPNAPAADMVHARVIEAIRQSSDIDRYSDPLGLPVLRNRIAQLLQQSGMDYADDEIMVTAGAIEAINATLQTFVTRNKREVIMPVPTYSAYERAIRCAKGTPVPIRLHAENGWQLDVNAIERAINSKTAAILLCNPNNPTGSLYSRETLVRLCELAKQHRFLLILDEVYGNMVFGDGELYSPCVDPAFRKNVVRIVSFSKDFNLTGWRIGFLHADRHIIEKITPVHDTLINCAPVASQYAAMAALDLHDEIIGNNRKAYEQRRNVMQQYLDDMAEWLSYTPVQGGYFFFPKLLIDVSASKFCYELMDKAKVIAIPGHDFGTDDTYIRLCFGRSLQDIHTGMERIHSYLRRHYSSPVVKLAPKTVVTSV